MNNKTCVDCVDPDSRNHQDDRSDDKGPHAVSDLEAGTEGEHNFVFWTCIYIWSPHSSLGLVYTFTHIPDLSIN